MDDTPLYLKLLQEQKKQATFREIAARIGKQASTVMRIMNGTHKPHQSTIAKIEAVFGD